MVEATDVRRELDALQRKYHDARHICYAYVLRPDRSEHQANDNGEPSGTAGRPILGQINSRGLTNVLVAVVRYFGGIKLGTPGLTAAYKQAASDVLELAPVTEQSEMTLATLIFPYVAMNDVMKVVKAMNVDTVAQDFDNLCRLTLSFPVELLDELKMRLVGVAEVQES